MLVGLFGYIIFQQNWRYLKDAQSLFNATYAYIFLLLSHKTRMRSFKWRGTWSGELFFRLFKDNVHHEPSRHDNMQALTSYKQQLKFAGIFSA